MISEPQEIGSGETLAARLPEVDFAVVLSRVIESIEHDPVQLRNAVYELARIKLQREVCRTHTPMEVRRLTLALESAIEGVETIYSKHDELRALRSLHRLIETSEMGRSKRREPLLSIKEQPAQTAYGMRRISENRIAPSNPSRYSMGRSYTSADSFAVRQGLRRSPPPRMARRGASLHVEPLSRWPRAAPSLRGAMVVIFAVAVSAILSQFGQLQHQTALSSPAQPVGQLRQQAALSSRSQPESAPTAPPAIAQIQDAPVNFSHQRLADAGVPGVGHAPSYSGRDLQVVPDEQPVKPAAAASCTKTYRVPSESGGQVSINVVRC